MIIANWTSCAPPPEPPQPPNHNLQHNHKNHRNHHHHHQRHNHLNHLNNNNSHRNQAQKNLVKNLVNLAKNLHNLDENLFIIDHRLAQIGFHSNTRQLINLILIQIYRPNQWLFHYNYNHFYVCFIQLFATIRYYIIVIKLKILIPLLPIVVNFIAIILNNQQMQRRRNRVSL